MGHSMGGYGATRIGMKHADVFGNLYIMSPCCLAPRPMPRAEDEAALASLKSLEEAAKLPFPQRAQLASASAWSPNPAKPPLYLDLPYGAGQQDVRARWAANLRRYRGIALDVGDQDGLKADTQKLHEALNRYGIANSFEIYPGTHVSHIALRFQDHVLPFFSRTLTGEKR